MNLETNTLKAALICAARKDVRYYLNGVHVEWSPSMAIYVGTDGHHLFAARRDTSPENMPSESGSVIIPRETIESFLKIDKSPTVDLTCIDGVWKLGPPAFDPIDGTYPDWRHVVPGKDEPLSGEAANYDPSLLFNAKKALAAACGQTINRFDSSVLYQNGMSAGVMVSSIEENDDLVVIMPMRVPASTPEKFIAPGWVVRDRVTLDRRP